jgi:hypothetical protein
MGASRVRSIQIDWLASDPGTEQRFDQHETLLGTTNSSGTAVKWNMTDVIGDPIPYPDHTMSLTKFEDYTIAFNGQRNRTISSGNRVVYSNFRSVLTTQLAHAANASSFDAVSSDYNDVAAATNPSRPSITPLTLMQDVIDLPRMIRDSGRLLRTPRNLMNAKQLANANLLAQFGWLPLIGDLHAILDFGSTVQKRHGELAKLYDRGWIGRTVQLGTARFDDDSGKTPKLISTSQFGCEPSPSFRWSRTTHCRKWGSSRWKLSQRPPYRPSDAEVLAQAKRLASGMTVEGMARGLWEIMPWTWLLDWFTHTGGFIRSYSNTVPATLTSCCVMVEKRTESSFLRMDNTSVTGGEGTTSYISKSRGVGHPSLFNISLPNISANSMSILGSLFVQRLK